MEELNNFKSKDQELMLENDESTDNIEEWSSKHESEVEENDGPLEELQKRTKELKEKKKKKKKQNKIRLSKNVFNEDMMKKSDLKT